MNIGILLFFVAVTCMAVSHLLHNMNLLNPVFKGAKYADNKGVEEIADNIVNITCEVQRSKSISECPILKSIIAKRDDLHVSISSKIEPSKYIGVSRSSYTIVKGERYLIVDQRKTFDAWHLNALNKSMLMMS
jgi:hypothetical protein